MTTEKKYNHQSSSTSSVYTTNQPLPQAVEVEECVLSALMISRDAVNKIVTLKSDDFYNSANALVFKAIMQLAQKFAAVDMFTVIEELKLMGELENAGGEYRIALLSTKTVSDLHLEQHAMIVKQKAVARKLIEMCSRASTLSYNEQEDVADTMEMLEKELTEISTGTERSRAYDMQESLQQVFDYMMKVQADAMAGKSNAIPTGLPDLDKAINGGWNAPDLIILGGRPSMGKTAFAVSFAKHAACAGKQSLFISIEMTKIQLVLRLVTEHEGIDYYRIKTGQLTAEEWNLVETKAAELLNLDIHIADDHNVRQLHNIKALARSFVRKGNLGMLIIDYLQLIKTNQKFGTRDLEIGHITGELKNLAKELNIPILLLAQLNRPQKGMKVTTPKLEDLRESGNIEQDADIVIFPHRPAYYDKEAFDESGSWTNRGFLVIGKNREGERDVRIEFSHDDKFKKIMPPQRHLSTQFPVINASAETRPF